MLATDYDRTIANEYTRKVPENVHKALLKVKEAGFLIVIVTARGVDDLLRLYSEIKEFDLIVAENGTVLYFPSQDKRYYLASKHPIEFIVQLMHHGIPFRQYEILTRVHIDYVEKVNNLIKEFQFTLHIISHNKAGYILPTGMNKAKGLEKALLHFNITSNQVIAVGDGENDLDFFDFCGFKVAVGNAEDTVKAKADWIATKEEGEGMVEFIQQYLLV